MIESNETYRQVCEHDKETQYLRSMNALLEWDHQTLLPKLGASYRSEQTTYLAGIIHERDTAPQLGEWLETLVSSPGGATSAMSAADVSAASANVRELHHRFNKRSKMPIALVQALARACSLGQAAWVEARQANDFSMFAPHLKEIFQLKREEAQAVGTSDRLYDALLDDYEPGADTEMVSQVLSTLKDDLIPLIQLASENANRVDAGPLQGVFPASLQKALGLQAMDEIGFDQERGRLDVAHHPFCTDLGPDDCRITTRYNESFFSTSFFGTLHEAGHGLYEQGLPAEYYGLPAGSYCSLGIHESQSRLWENLVGRSRGFWRHFYPKVQQTFGETLSAVDGQAFWSAINQVRPSLIRVEADEATYNLHIIVRFELEEALLEQRLTVDDLPDAWNEKYQHYLGIQSDTHADGVLQDIHWSAGLIGYFPTYSLGNIYASQMFEAAGDSLGDLEQAFSEGNFRPLLNWLRERVHVHGNRWRAPQLINRVVGGDLDPKPLVEHLRSKIEAIYRG